MFWCLSLSPCTSPWGARLLVSYSRSQEIPRIKIVVYQNPQDLQKHVDHWNLNKSNSQADMLKRRLNSLLRHPLLWISEATFWAHLGRERSVKATSITLCADHAIVHDCQLKASWKPVRRLSGRPHSESRPLSPLCVTVLSLSLQTNCKEKIKYIKSHWGVSDC